MALAEDDTAATEKIKRTAVAEYTAGQMTKALVNWLRETERHPPWVEKLLEASQCAGNADMPLRISATYDELRTVVSQPHITVSETESADEYGDINRRCEDDDVVENEVEATQPGIMGGTHKKPLQQRLKKRKLEGNLAGRQVTTEIPDYILPEYRSLYNPETGKVNPRRGSKPKGRPYWNYRTGGYQATPP